MHNYISFAGRASQPTSVSRVRKREEWLCLAGGYRAVLRGNKVETKCVHCFAYTTTTTATTRNGIRMKSAEASRFGAFRCVFSLQCSQFFVFIFGSHVRSLIKKKNCYCSVFSWVSFIFSLEFGWQPCGSQQQQHRFVFWFLFFSLFLASNEFIKWIIMDGFDGPSPYTYTTSSRATQTLPNCIYLGRVAAAALVNNRLLLLRTWAQNALLPPCQPRSPSLMTIEYPTTVGCA